MSDMLKTKRWEQKRAAILRRDGYVDQLAKRYGRTIQATTVHHIFPRDQFPEYQWENWNLISVSAETHDKLHYRRTQELTELGMDLLTRTARKNNINLPLR